MYINVLTKQILNGKTPMEPRGYPSIVQGGTAPREKMAAGTCVCVPRGCASESTSDVLQGFEGKS